MSAGPEVVLVVGTYPPIPLPAAAASVDAVRRSWGQGFDTAVVSPRLSAADLMVPVCGPLAGVRLERMRRRFSATRLVLVIEEGFPFTPGPRAVQLVTATGLRRAMAAFGHTTVIIVGQPSVPGDALSMCTSVADTVQRWPGPVTSSPVTPLGPPEYSRREQPAVLAAKVARRLLGRHATPVAARVRAVRSRAGERWGRRGAPNA